MGPQSSDVERKMAIKSTQVENNVFLNLDILIESSCKHNGRENISSNISLHGLNYFVIIPSLFYATWTSFSLMVHMVFGRLIIPSISLFVQASSEQVNLSVCICCFSCRFTFSTSCS